MRKFTFFIFLFLISISGFSQATGFAVANNQLVWENVFVSNEMNVPSLIGRHSKMKIVSSDGTIYKGVAKDILISSCTDASKIFKYGVNFSFEIELSDGKYRVTVSDIIFNNQKKGKTKTPAEKSFVVSGKTKSTVEAVNDLTCLETYFNKVFTMMVIYKNRS